MRFGYAKEKLKERNIVGRAESLAKNKCFPHINVVSLIIITKLKIITIRHTA